jgi:hypothetical protein
MPTGRFDAAGEQRPRSDELGVAVNPISRRRAGLPGTLKRSRLVADTGGALVGGAVRRSAGPGRPLG